MPVLMKLGTGADLQSCPYLRSYDLDAHDGYGRIVLTRNQTEAQRFPDAGTAMQAWRSASTVRPLRPDGKPNRPLTAFSASFEEVSA